jgi:hypothetical protein
VDPLGSAYVFGHTKSINFPTINPLLPANTSGWSFFLTKLSSSGSSLVYSTYVGGGFIEAFGGGIAVDSGGNAYISAFPNSNFPLVNPLQTTGGFFVAKVNASGNAFIYSTLWGGSGGDTPNALAIDPAGNVYVTGQTLSIDFPLVNAVQTTFGGGFGDAFVTKINAAGTAVVFSTYLGGRGLDLGSGIAADAAGNTYVTGAAGGSDFPTFHNLQPAGGFQDGFAAKFSPTGSFVYSTFLSAGGGTFTTAIAADVAGNAYVAGSTGNSSFPTVNPIQPTLHGFSNVVVSKLNAAGSALVFSTFLGGGSENAASVAVDPGGNIYVAGGTSSEEFPTVNPVQPAIHGLTNAFVAKIAEGSSPSVTDISPAGGQQGNSIPVTLHGSGFASGSTGVAVSGSGITVGPVTVADSNTLNTVFTIDPSARPDLRRVSVTTPGAIISSVSFMVASSLPSCPVSLPVTVTGDPLSPDIRFGIGATAQTAGTWALGLVTYDGSAFAVSGHELYTSGFPAMPVRSFTDSLQFPQSNFLVGVLNAFFTPDLCVYNLSLVPGVGGASRSPHFANGRAGAVQLDDQIRQLKLNDFVPAVPRAGTER